MAMTNANKAEEQKIKQKIHMKKKVTVKKRETIQNLTAEQIIANDDDRIKKRLSMK